ncbi:MAG TPA: DEAD/DEAH box helicase family protein [Phycisphaerales bacterium]|nr:DEAD/DEAH box helicase family protein [Phycisphaerales bacterium]HMP38519.1 DEAD/DEAH box helicase family protein [Phycisphaerales bacterium]
MTLTEADTRAKLIDPAIHARGWSEDLICREVTLGAVEIVNDKGRRRSSGRTDYTLRIRVNAETQPVAVALIEAKKESLPPGHGLDQAKGYLAANRHNVQFVFSSNGHLFVEFDRSTGLTSAPRPLSEFPTPTELRARYEAIVGFSLDSPAARPLLTRYAGGEGQRRYFQDAAIRAVFEKVARCAETRQPPRALLSLATGTGKTFIACNLLKRVADAGQLKRALFLCDRDELRTQGLKAMQNIFGADAAEVYEADGRNNAKNARVHIATYQTLGIDKDDGDPSFLFRHYPEGYFSHIVIDECHRSAWGKWSVVLTRNPDAVQIGLTATPRQLKCAEQSEEAKSDAKITADNLAYFGEPVYEYGLAQAMEDGYLAACAIELAQVNLDATGLTLADIITRNPRNANTGQPVTAKEIADLYEKQQFETKLLLPDRVNAMCLDLFTQLVNSDTERGPHQKTIIFCARDRHADDVAVAMNNLYAQWCAQKGVARKDPFAFKCTAASSGNDALPDLRGSSSSHFIATTVDLLTTGVDVPPVRNIAFFRYMKSPISFYQMIGRGTRIDEPTGKLMFTVYDYTGATRLFGEDFVTAPPGGGGERHGGGDDADPSNGATAPIEVDGFFVQVSPQGRYVVGTVDGRAMPVPLDQYKAGLSARLIAECPTLEAFRARWVNPPQREEIIDAIVSAGYSPSVLRMLEQMNDYDLYDVLADLAYGLLPRTREDRCLAFRYKHAGWLAALPAPAKAAVEAIADQFAVGGTEGLENPHIWQTPEVAAAGGIAALQSAGEPRVVLQQTKERMFAA